jgi:Transglutaminase-like enzymes, putative cysteine proteases
MYEEYEKKMVHMSEVLRRVRTGIFIALAILIPSFLLCFGVGFCYRGMSCKSVTYGEAPDPSTGCTAIGEVVYEYRSTDDKDAEWSTDVPREVGNYEVRARSVSFLGVRREIDSTDFSIRPRTLKVSLANISVNGEVDDVEVSDKDITFSGLVYGDTVDEARVVYEYVSSSEKWYHLEDIHVSHKDGTSALDCYEISNKNSGTIRDSREYIVIQAGSKTVKYDGNPYPDLTCDEWKLIGGSLKPGHHAEFRCELERTTDGFGEWYNVIDMSYYSITDTSGRDVSDQYVISTRNGVVQFVQRSIKIKTDSATKEYDGITLTKDTYQITGDGLAEGDRLTLQIYGSQTEVGVSKNYFDQVEITSDRYGDVTYCYNISKTEGSLRVTGKKDDQGGDNAGKIDGSGMGYSMPDGDKYSLSDSGFSLSPNPAIVFSFCSQTFRTYYFRECYYCGFDGHSWYGRKDAKETEIFGEYLAGRQLRAMGCSEDNVYVRNNILGEALFPYFLAEEQKVEDPENYKCVTYVPTLDLDYYDYQSYDYIDQDELAYRDFVYSVYMDVPEETRQVLLELAYNAGISEYDEKSYLIMEVANYIQNAAQYTLNFGDFPEDEDMVVYFLTKGKKGVCQHYASAATLMYRALGIPARYVIGLAHSGRGRQWSNVTSNDGHAWTEVYIDGIGWIPVEVTGGGSIGDLGGGAADFDDVSFDDIDLDENYLVIGLENYIKVYDGKPLGSIELDWYLIYGILQNGHSIVGPKLEMEDYYNTYPMRVDYLEVDWDAYHVVDSAGNDVTDQYEIVVNTPQVAIENREIGILVSGVKDELTGSGKAHSTIVRGSLVSGHRIEFITSTSPNFNADAQFDCGYLSVGMLGDKELFLYILDEDGIDVTQCYAVSVSNVAELGSDY